MKSEFKKAGTLQLTGIRRIAGEQLCVRAAGADGSGRTGIKLAWRWTFDIRIFRDRL